MRWLNKWFSFSWKKLALVAALVPVMWFFKKNDFPRTEGFIRDALQHLNLNSEFDSSFVTININKEKEVFPRPLKFESLKPLLDKVFESNPKKVVIMFSPRELQPYDDKKDSTRRRLFDYLKSKENAYLYSIYDDSEDDIWEDKILTEFPRVLSYEMLPDTRWGPRDSKRRRVMIWYDKLGPSNSFAILKKFGLNIKEPEHYKHLWSFWGSKQAYIKTFSIGTFGSYDAQKYLESNGSIANIKDKVVIVGTNDEYSFMTQMSVLDLSDQIAVKGLKGYPPSDALANYLNFHTTGDYIKFVQNFKDLMITFLILVILIFLNVDIKKKIYVFAALIPFFLLSLAIVYITTSFYIDITRSLIFLFLLQYISIPVIALTIFKEQETRRLKEINDVRIDALLSVSEKVAHDIRSPLSAINLVAERATFPDVEYKEIFDGAVKRIDDTATKILTQYRTSSGREHQKIEKINLSEIINEITKEKKILTSNINFEVVTNVENENALGIKLDLERIISNILDNSIFAMKHIINPKIFIAIEENENMIRLNITDNGTGIPEQILKVIGNARITTKSDTGEGNGIGLLHAKRVIERLNGKFEIESKENVGTTIKVSLPKA